MATLKLGKEPGVYSQEVVNPALAITEARLKVAGLVGHSTPTLTVNNIAVVRGSTNTDLLPYGAALVQSVVCISDYVGAVGTNLPQYSSGTDFTWTKGATGNAIKWETTGTSPVKGATYYVNIILVKDATYYVPKKFGDSQSVTAYYGPEWYVDSKGVAKVNEISLAARLMFNNGADVLWVCEAQAGVDGAPVVKNVKDAIALLDDLDLQNVVCIYMTEEIQRYLATRVVIDSATENQRERIGWINAITDEVDAIVTQSTSYKEQRIVNIAPSKVTVIAEDAQGIGKEFEVPSTFAAAALSGLLVNNSRMVSMPLTRVVPVGIYGVSKVYKRPEIEQLSAAGTFVLKSRDGSILVNQSVTTDNTNQNNREVSVVLIKDEVLKALRYNLDKNFIGKFYNRNKTPTEIKSAIINVLNTFVNTRIESFDQSNIIVIPDGEDSTRVNVTLAFAVLRPLNYIYLSFQVVL